MLVLTLHHFNSSPILLFFSGEKFGHELILFSELSREGKPQLVLVSDLLIFPPDLMNDFFEIDDCLILFGCRLLINPFLIVVFLLHFILFIKEFLEGDLQFIFEKE